MKHYRNHDACSLALFVGVQAHSLVTIERNRAVIIERQDALDRVTGIDVTQLEWLHVLLVEIDVSRQLKLRGQALSNTPTTLLLQLVIDRILEILIRIRSQSTCRRITTKSGKPCTWFSRRDKLVD